MLDKFGAQQSPQHLPTPCKFGAGNVLNKCLTVGFEHATLALIPVVRTQRLPLILKARACRTGATQVLILCIAQAPRDVLRICWTNSVPNINYLATVPSFWFLPVRTPDCAHHISSIFSQGVAFIVGNIASRVLPFCKLENLPGMIASVWSKDSSMQLEATTQFQKLVLLERSPPIQEVIQSGVVSRFIEFLMRAEYPQLQFEAAWALTNIASGISEHTKVVIDLGAVPIFVQLLGSPSDEVGE